MATRNRRSESTRERLIDAVNRLLAEGTDIAAISVNQICIEADVSPSSMYNLYPSKEDLLEDVHARYIERIRNTVLDAADEHDWSAMEPRDFVHLVLEHFLVFETEFALEMNAMAQLRRSSRSLTDQHLRNERELGKLARDQMVAALGRAGDEETSKRVDFVMLTATAVIQRSFLSHRPVETLLEIDSEEFLDRLTDMILSYLQMDHGLD